MLGVQVLEAFAGDVRVDLGRRQIAMTQQHLNHAQIRAVIQEMCCEGMAQGMRRQFFLDAGLGVCRLAQLLTSGPASFATAVPLHSPKLHNAGRHAATGGTIQRNRQGDGELRSDCRC